MEPAFRIIYWAHGEILYRVSAHAQTAIDKGNVIAPIQREACDKMRRRCRRDIEPLSNRGVQRCRHVGSHMVRNPVPMVNPVQFCPLGYHFRLGDANRILIVLKIGADNIQNLQNLHELTRVP